MSRAYDVAVVGGGPSGSVSAAHCAKAGLRVVLLEKATFPRDKICGDCLNPRCWEIFDRLDISDAIRALPHAPIQSVEFIGIQRAPLSIPFPGSGEIAVRRALLDDLLLRHAIECGVEVRQNALVQSVHTGWALQTSVGEIAAKTLIAADGRNSTIARALRLFPKAQKDRIGLQTHVPLPAGFESKVVLRFLSDGYCGLAPIGENLLNVCLVARPDRMKNLRAWAEREFRCEKDQTWRSITPLRRRPVAPAHPRLFFVGDAARVVEPFTGEGIFYALATAELAARCIVENRPLSSYAKEHAALYRGRLWINHLAREAVLHPRIATFALELFRHRPAGLRFLTAKVASPSAA